MSRNAGTEQDVKRLSQHTAHSLENMPPAKLVVGALDNGNACCYPLCFLRRWHCVEMMNERNIPAK